MILDTPLQTVAPVVVSFVIWAVCLFRLRAQFTLPRAWWALALLVLGVRLFWVPALSAHIFDGHEAEYWDLFRGAGAPTRGGTVMVPAMQWFWWLSGQVLPAWPRLPVLMMSAVGLAAIGLAGGALGILAGRRAGWVVALLLAVHPAHAAWSSSAYNVILPHFFGCLALFGVARGLGSPNSTWRWLVASSLALGVATRMDTAATAVMVAMLVIMASAAPGGRLRRLRSWVLPGLGAAVLAMLAAWPMLWPGGLPGAGGRSQSFSNNLLFFEVYAPFDTAVGLFALCVLSVVALRKRPAVAFPFVLTILLHHGVMISFDDFGERHGLVVLPALLGLVAIASQVKHGAIRILVIVVAGLSLSQTHDLSHRFYGSEDAFLARLNQPPWDGLPRVNYSGVPPKSCGWVAEDQRVAANPVASHFNLLDPEEALKLRGEAGCLKWCLDTQDWRWSSRAVRDRAQRLSHLFVLSPSHVVVDPSTGYACLVMDVGDRTRSFQWFFDGNNPTTPSGDSPIP